MSPGTDAAKARLQVRTYLAALPPGARRNLKKLRAAIRFAAPRAVEAFSYGIPGFRLTDSRSCGTRHGRNTRAPMSAAIRRAHAAHLQDYKTSKGTIRFPLTRPPSSALVKRLVKARIAEIRSRKT